MNKILISFLILVSVLMPLSSAYALPGFSYGGRTIFFFPCACSFNLYLWLWPFYPYFVYSGAPISLPPFHLALRHMNWLPELPGSSQVGKFLWGVQSCWEWVGEACVPLPTVGIIIETGSAF